MHILFAYSLRKIGANVRAPPHLTSRQVASRRLTSPHLTPSPRGTYIPRIHHARGDACTLSYLNVYNNNNNNNKKYIYIYICMCMCIYIYIHMSISTRSRERRARAGRRARLSLLVRAVERAYACVEESLCVVERAARRPTRAYA